MINLNSLPSYSVGRLTRVSPRKDPDGGLGALFWDIEICFDIQSKSEASVIDSSVPGALAVYSAGQIGSKGEVKDASEYEVIRCSLWSADQDRRRVASSHAEIRQSVVRCKGPISVYILRMRLHGLITKFAINICSYLDSNLVVYVDSAKNKGVDTIEAAEVRVSEKHAGSILLTNTSECYVINQETIHGFVVCSIDGEEQTIPKFLVDTVMKLAHGYEESCELVKKYSEECVSKGCPAKLENLVGALAKQFVSGVEPPPNGWVIDDDVIESAVSISIDSVVENVEPADA